MDDGGDDRRPTPDRFLTVDDIAERLPRGRAWLLQKLRADERRPLEQQRYTFHRRCGRSRIWTAEEAEWLVEALVAESTERYRPPVHYVSLAAARAYKRNHPEGYEHPVIAFLKLQNLGPGEEYDPKVQERVLKRADRPRGPRRKS